MQQTIWIRFIACLGVSIAAGFPGWARAATPSILLEDSQSYALDNLVRAFRVPVIGADGKIKYYDVTITLGLNSSGVPASATVASALSPSIGTGAITPGNYKTSTGQPCVVTNITLTNGRIQSFFSCTAASARQDDLSVATGTITAGHPYLTQLTAFNINKLTDVATYTWGLATNISYANLGGCTVYQGSPLGMKSNGSQVIVASYYPGNYNPSRFLCNFTLTRQ